MINHRHTFFFGELNKGILKLPLGPSLLPWIVLCVVRVSAFNLAQLHCWRPLTIYSAQSAALCIKNNVIGWTQAYLKHFIHAFILLFCVSQWTCLMLGNVIVKPEYYEHGVCTLLIIHLVGCNKFAYDIYPWLTHK